MPAGESAPTNRLHASSNPWLAAQSHAPVDWWPWSDAAFEEARRRGVPVLVASGYAACHWCHRMERECYEQPELARLQNETVVSIRLDRDEHPEIDRYLVGACQLLNRSSGWPLHVFLTPDGRPFHAGTWYPPTAQHGRAAWPDVLRAVGEAWRNQTADVETAADDLREALARIHAPRASAADSPWNLASALTELRGRYDRVWGGFGEAPKFPSFPMLRLVEASAELGEPADREHLARTWTHLLSGGIHDPIHGGLFRYATDGRWHVPHFEKMLVDQGQFLSGLAAAAARTSLDASSLHRVARRTATLLHHAFGGREGGFAHSLDAESDREEGAWYLWTPGELADALGDEPLARRWAEKLGITAEGNYRPKGAQATTGRTAPRRAWPGSDDDADAERAVLDRLRAARAARTSPPARDDRRFVLGNALAVSGLAHAAMAFGDPLLLEPAIDALRALVANAWTPSGLERGWIALDEARVTSLGPARTEDAAALLHALLDVASATGDGAYLERAIDVADWTEATLRREDGLFRPVPEHALDVRAPSVAAVFDDAVASPAAMVLDALLRLAAAVADDARSARVEASWRACAGAADAHGLACASLIRVGEQIRAMPGPALLDGGDDRSALDRAHAAWPHLRGGDVAVHGGLIRDGASRPFEALAERWRGTLAPPGGAARLLRCAGGSCALPIALP